MEGLDGTEGMPNITGNFSEETFSYEESIYDRLFLELFTIIGICSFAANVLVVLTILMYKKLRSEVSNILLVHLNILEGTVLLSAPLTLRTAMISMSSTDIQEYILCIFFEIEASMVCLSRLILLLLLVDGYLSGFHPNLHKVFTKTYKYLLVVFYMIFTSLAGFTIDGCLNDAYYVDSVYTASILILIIFLLLIVLNIVRYVKKRRSGQIKSDIGLAVTNIIYLFWAPWLFIWFLNNFIYIDCPFLYIVISSLGFSSPIFYTLYLYKYEGNFQVFFTQILKCRCNDYKNEDLDDAVNYNGDNGVKIYVT